jgi:3'-phosphoadenosine 5'-phosphosulfate sulfotransferase (PAPS reductase)/FAD synthetase
MKEKYQISFSGGRTSGYMTKMLIDNFSDQYDFIVTFANTGMEHNKTLEFVHSCDVHFGFRTVWLETVVHAGRTACTHKVVDFDSASRRGEPYQAVIEKYGVPNVSFPYCTREMKLNPMRSYLKALGINHKDLKTAVGIRADEKRRVSKTATEFNIVYPLIDIWPTDKQDVLDWWSEQDFDLGIDEFEGNCLGCFKKSLRKHFLQMERDPSCYEFYGRMEDRFKSVGPQVGDRVFFRGNTSKQMLFWMHEEFVKAGSQHAPQLDIYADGGCSESCEIFETATPTT